MGSRTKADEKKILHLSTHCTATQKEQSSEPVSKRAFLLNPNQISELIMDSGSNESLYGVAAMEEKEYCAEVSLEHLQLQNKCTACSSA